MLAGRDAGAAARHDADGRSLREMGVLNSSYEPHKFKTDGGAADRFRWEEALELLGPDRLLRRDQRLCSCGGCGDGTAVA